MEVTPSSTSEVGKLYIIVDDAAKDAKFQELVNGGKGITKNWAYLGLKLVDDGWEFETGNSKIEYEVNTKASGARTVEIDLDKGQLEAAPTAHMAVIFLNSQGKYKGLVQSPASLAESKGLVLTVSRDGVDEVAVQQ